MDYFLLHLFMEVTEVELVVAITESRSSIITEVDVMSLVADRKSVV